MFTPMKHAIALGAAMLFCATAGAQTALQPTTRPDPLNANAAVPTLTFQSSFANYRRMSEASKPLSWREANEAAARIGGWRVYAREAQMAEPAPAAAVPPASAASQSNAHQHQKP